MINTLHQYKQLLLRYLAAQWGAVGLMGLLLVASTGLQVAGPQVVRGFIDAVQRQALNAVLIRTALLYLGVTLAHQTLRVLATYWGQRVAWRATNALRSDLASHLVKLDLSFHKAHTPGELIERVDGDVTVLAQFFSSLAVELLSSLLLLIGILIAIFAIDWQLGVAFALFALIGLAALTAVWRAGGPYWEKEREQQARYYGYLGEVLTATEDLRSSGATDYVLRRFFENIRQWLPIRVRAGFWGQSTMNAVILLFALGDALAYGLGGNLYQSGAISLGVVYLILAYIAMLAAPIETIRHQLQNLQQADASIKRIRDLFAIQSTLHPGAHDLPPGPLAVQAHHLTFTYNDLPNIQSLNLPSSPLHVPTPPSFIPHPPTLHNLTFHLPAGQVLGLLGRTGSGKSTLARLLFRLYDGQAGELCVGGVNLRETRLESLCSRVGLVTQDVQLFAATLRDNITFFDNGVTDSHLYAVLHQLGLGDWLARQPQGLDTLIHRGALSAGEAQLLALARVFTKDPGLIILDEASSRLDPATESLLDRALDVLLDGRTAIIIAHRLPTVERADVILMLEAGQIVEYGSRPQLAADPTSRFAQLRHIGMGDVLA